MEYVGFILVVLNVALIAGAVMNRAKRLSNSAVGWLCVIAVMDVVVGLFTGLILVTGR